MPAEATRIRTHPGRTSGTGRSTTSMAPSFVHAAAFIVPPRAAGLSRGRVGQSLPREGARIQEGGRGGGVPATGGSRNHSDTMYNNEGQLQSLIVWKNS